MERLVSGSRMGLRRFAKQIALAVMLAFLASCMAQPPGEVDPGIVGDCPAAEVERALGDLADRLAAFSDVNVVAHSTPRLALAGLIGELQQTRREAEGVAVPDCLAAAKGYLLEAMDQGIEGYVHFLGGKDERVVEYAFEMGAAALDQYQAEVERVVVCVPECQEELGN